MSTGDEFLLSECRSRNRRQSIAQRTGHCRGKGIFPSFSRRGAAKRRGGLFKLPIIGGLNQPPRLRFAQPPLLEKEGSSLKHHMNPFTQSITLNGEHAVLEPLSLDHHDALMEATRDGELWKLW